MRCPFCHHDNDKVIDSRAAEAGYMHRRKRLCQDCQRRFTTIEQIEELNVRVVKNDGTREPFDREKIRRGIERACSKREVESDRIEATVQLIETDIYAAFDFEIPAHVIGEIVLRHLADLDEVAYIRFASVYREFDGADDFLKIIRQLSPVDKAYRAQNADSNRASEHPTSTLTR
ncbi:MAG: transcriptional regulator NrdR [Planctomycetota bacterium]